MLQDVKQPPRIPIREESSLVRAPSSQGRVGSPVAYPASGSVAGADAGCTILCAVCTQNGRPVKDLFPFLIYSCCPCLSRIHSRFRIVPVLDRRWRTYPCLAP
jgi:hypothetical protein